jgi:hypothetical protein
MKRVVGVPRDFGQLDGLGNSMVVYVTLCQQTLKVGTIMFLRHMPHLV